MIYKSIRKRLTQVPLGDEIKTNCLTELDKIENKTHRRHERYSKADLIIKCCLKLTKLSDKIKTSTDIKDGLVILQFVKRLLMDIYQVDRVEVHLIKIRTYLLMFKWSRIGKHSLDKMTNRLNLFLQKLKENIHYQTISHDFYSHIERLYLQAIEQNLKEGKINQCKTFISQCMECFKGQINLLTFNFDEQKVTFNNQQKKRIKLMDEKGKLLNILFQLEYGINMLNTSSINEEIMTEMTARYERISSKIPNLIFPKKETIQTCINFFQSHNKNHSQNRDNLKHRHSSIKITPMKKIDTNVAIQKSESIFKLVKLRSKSDFLTNDLRKTVDFEQFGKKIHKPSKFMPFINHNLEIGESIQIQPLQKQINGLKIYKLSSLSQIDKTKKLEPKLKEDKKIKEIKQFNLITNIDNKQRQKLKLINPLKTSKTIDFNVSQKEMLKGGIFFVQNKKDPQFEHPRQ